MTDKNTRGKGKNYKIKVSRLNDDFEVINSIYFKTYKDLKRFYNIPPATLQRYLNGKPNKRLWKYIKFEMCNIHKDLGDFLNDIR